MKRNAQGLLEYVLVFLFAAVVLYFFAGQINLAKLKTFAIYGVRDQSNTSKIIIPPMSD